MRAALCMDEQSGFAGVGFASGWNALMAPTDHERLLTDVKLGQ